MKPKLLTLAMTKKDCETIYEFLGEVVLNLGFKVNKTHSRFMIKLSHQNGPNWPIIYCHVHKTMLRFNGYLNGQDKWLNLEELSLNVDLCHPDSYSKIIEFIKNLMHQHAEIA